MEVIEKGKTVKNAAKQEKLSYEELENIAHQLSEQSRVLAGKLEQVNMTNVFKRLDYLFQVLEIGHMFPEEFVNDAVGEIMELITVPKNQEEIDLEDKEEIPIGE